MASLLPYSQPLGLRKAKHLLRRASFNYSKFTLDAFAALTPTEAIGLLTADNETNAWEKPYDPLPTDSPDGDWTNSVTPYSLDGQGRKRIIISAWWWYNAMNQTTLKHKLTFFLHTSFTVSKDGGAGNSIQFYDHIRLLEKYAFGNLQTLAYKVTIDNAMLDYLDNTDNNSNNPNENYAREFLELFTILKGPQIAEGNYTNYTELDVQQAAKVLSGFKTDRTRSVIDPETNLPMGRIQLNKHDTNDKTFSEAFDGKVITGKDNEEEVRQELKDFIAMVFDKEATALSYCRKLYRYFVKSEWNDEVENDIIKPLAAELKRNGYEILPIVKKLLLSEHFYDADDLDVTDETIGSIVKSPLQMITEMTSLFQLSVPDPITAPADFYQFFKFVHNAYFNSTGFDFFSPDSVAGYPANYQEPDFDRHWFSSNTVVGRYSLMTSLLTGRDKIVNNARLATELDLLTFVKNNISTPEYAETLVSELSDLLYPEAIDDERKSYFMKVLLDDYESYYWTESWGDYLNTGNTAIVKNRLDDMVTTMVNAPEFQLM